MQGRLETWGRRAGMVAVLLLPALVSRAATIRVPLDAPTIQAGVDRAVAGDTVLVDAGSWSELVVLDGRTGLDIKGAGMTATLLEAPGPGPAFTLRGCSNVSIERFHLSSVDLGGDSPTNGAITLDASTSVVVHHVLITHQSGNGVLVHDDSDLHAYENVIVKVGDDAISFRGTTSNGIVHDNTFADNGTNAGIPGGSGIGVYAHSAGSVVVFDNISYGNDYGLAVEGGATFDHDFNLVGGSGVQDYYGLSAAPGEQTCPPAFVDPLNLDYHIASTSCAIDAGTTSYSGTASADLDMDDAPKPLGAAPDEGADEAGCTVDVAGWQDLVHVCEGGTARLDSTSIGLPDCPSSPVARWTDDPAAPEMRNVSPTVDTTYEVTVSCPSLPKCEVTRTVLVTVSRRPEPFGATAQDVAPCNRGILVQWDRTTFHGPGGSGTYSVYRSAVSCAGARAGSALAAGLTGTQWVDGSATPGTAYFYVIEAEDDASPSLCPPLGPTNGGATTLACIATPAVDLVDSTPPADPGPAVLRARHAGEQITVLWPSARPLLPNEHFHLIKTWGRPVGGWRRANPELDLSSSFTETDTSASLQCVLLRVANACETESP